MKIALIHDYLREFGGAERVLMVLHEMFPQAPVYTAFIDRQAMGIHSKHFADWDIRQTWLARVPLIKKLYSPLRFLAPKAFADLDLAKFDLVISSSNAYFAKAVRVPNGQHLCYCHTPPRVLWGYTAMGDWRRNPLVHFAGSILNHFMRVVDVQVSRQNVDLFIANSRETARRIKKFYRLDSTVVYPPIDLPTTKLTPTQDRSYYLYVNRLALAKHPELAVAAATKLDLPLKVVGTGKMLADLQAMAGPTVEFLGGVSDQELQTLYAQAKALIYPAEDEDFGMVPVEAMGWGTPVIAHRSGGPLETVVEGKTGVFFEELNVASLVKALEQFKSQKYNSQTIHRHAKKFDQRAFVKGINRAISQLRVIA
jgi:glycosyltransferase involved in cell wall biosynthesis